MSVFGDSWRAVRLCAVLILAMSCVQSRARAQCDCQLILEQIESNTYAAWVAVSSISNIIATSGTLGSDVRSIDTELQSLNLGAIIGRLNELSTTFYDAGDPSYFRDSFGVVLPQILSELQGLDNEGGVSLFGELAQNVELIENAMLGISVDLDSIESSTTVIEGDTQAMAADLDIVRQQMGNLLAWLVTEGTPLGPVQPVVDPVDYEPYQGDLGTHIQSIIPATGGPKMMGDPLGLRIPPVWNIDLSILDFLGFQFPEESWVIDWSFWADVRVIAGLLLWFPALTYAASIVWEETRRY